MKVALVTSSDVKCGIGEYGKYLMKELPQVDWTVVGHRSLETDLRGKQFDIVHLNYEPGLFPPPNVAYALQFGRRSLLTLHASQSGDNRSPITEAFNKTVVHEFCFNVNNPPGTRFVFIPMGIPERVSPEELAAGTVQSHLPPLDIGSVGFPFPWKGFPQVANAAFQLDMSCGLIMAESPHFDVRPVEAACRAACPTKLMTVTKWISERDVIASLSNCKVNVFAYQGSNAGISGAVRLGLATGNPIVMTRCRQFCDLFIYQDEIEFVESPHPQHIAQGIQRVLANGKKPKRVLEDMSWKITARKYLEVYQSLLN